MASTDAHLMFSTSHLMWLRTGNTWSTMSLMLVKVDSRMSPATRWPCLVAV